jgi:hypothetical protein
LALWSGPAASLPVEISATTSSPVPAAPSSVTQPAPLLTPSAPIVVTRNDVTIDGVIITAGGSSGNGIAASGTSSAPIRNLTIQNCVIRGFSIGILAEHVENLVVRNCTIEDADYAGIAVYSGVGGRITGNNIRRIGVARKDLTVEFVENNAYGITLDRSPTMNFETDPRSSDFVVTGNLIEDVPLWHGLDTHAGQGITFSNNTVRRTPRAIFVTGDSTQLHHPIDITVTGNRIEEAATKAGGTSSVAITIAGLQGGSVTDNLVSETYPTPWVLDYVGPDSPGSVGVTIAGTEGIP